MIKENTPVSNPELTRAITRMYHEGTRESKEAVLQCLIRAQLLAPVVVIREGKQDRVQFMLLPNQEGKNFFPAFTDLEELRKHFDNPEQQTLILSFADFAGMILRDNSAAGLAVNPFGENLTLGRDLVEQVVGDMGALQARMKLSTPQPWPEVLARAIRNQTALLAEVQRVWLCWAEDAGGGQGYLLLVDFTGPAEPVFRALAQAVRPFLNGARADMAGYDGRYETAIRDIEPVYKR